MTPSSAGKLRRGVFGIADATSVPRSYIACWKGYLAYFSQTIVRVRLNLSGEMSDSTYVFCFVQPSRRVSLWEQ